MCIEIRITRFMGVSPFYFKRLGVDKKQCFYRKQCIENVAEEAIRRLPIEIEPPFAYNDNDDEYEYMGRPRHWSLSRIYYIQFNDGSIAILVDGYSGDHNSIAFIKRELVRQLTDDAISLMNRQICFEKRLPYLSLLEGIDLDDLESDDPKHYLLNLLVGKDICANMIFLQI